jgi:hypothetical protein
VSVITVEYDIREDQPEGTEVFELEPSSTDLIEKLVQRRFQHISAVDRHTIANFSGGNARIAIALAETVGREETVAGMSDEDLFKRLFEQRHAPSESLLSAAQGLSLVYSFKGEDVSDGNDAELFRLGAVVGKSAQEMFQSAAELGHRRLVQRRGVWRAVLPQAIANRLAARALQNISATAIEKHIVNEAPERLLKSFSRRLGYLDRSLEARQIVRRWLGPGGFLADVLNLNDLGSTIFRNVAPVDPEATLSALEGAMLPPTSDESAKKCARYVWLLASLAYEARHFERSIGLLTRIAVAVAEGGSHGVIGRESNEASRAVASLFPIRLSGTNASPEQRETVIRSLLHSSSPAERELGLKALEATLEALHFGPVVNFGFGARSRDFGYWPDTREAVVRWFSRFLKLAEDLASSSHIEASRLRAVVANKFRGLWTRAAMYDELERVCRTLSKEVFWVEGWIAVRQITYYDTKGFTPELINRLASLEALLQPRGTVQRVRSIVLAGSASYVGVPLVGNADENVESAWSRLQNLAYDLGQSVARDSDAFAELLPEMITARGDQVWSFGRSLAQGASDPVTTWKGLVGQLKIAPKGTASSVVFCGFLKGLYEVNQLLAGSLLDEAIESDLLWDWYPVLETAIGTIDASGFRRLNRSLDFGKTPVHIYRALVGGGVTHGLFGSDFNELLLKISDRPGGADVAIEILFMRISFNRESSSPEELVEIGCELICRIKVNGGTNPEFGYRLQLIGKHCLLGDKGAAAVREVCANLRNAISRSEASVYGHREFLQVLFAAQPLAVLQSLCGGDAAMVEIGVGVLENSSMLHPHAFDAILEEELLHWCDELPDVRYPIAAAGIAAIRRGSDGPHWTDIACRVLERSPDRIHVLRKFISQFQLPGRDILQAAEVESDLRLLDEMPEYSDPGLLDFAVREKRRLSQAIAAAREMRLPVHMGLDESFE